LHGNYKTIANMKDLTKSRYQTCAKKKKQGIITKELNSSTLSGMQNIA